MDRASFTGASPQALRALNRYFVASAAQIQDAADLARAKILRDPALNTTRATRLNSELASGPLLNMHTIATRLAGMARYLNDRADYQDLVSRGETVTAPPPVYVSPFAHLDDAAASDQPGGTRVGSMNLQQINEILAHPKNYSYGVVAAAYARKDLLEHQSAWDNSNPHVGTIRGNQSEGTDGRPSDCTEYVVDIMRRTYAAERWGEGLTFVRDENGRITDVLGPTGKHLGREPTFESILSEAARRSGAKGLTGAQLLAAMERREGWGGVFWAPDPEDPFDGDAHHRKAYHTARQTGSYFGVTVDKDDMVVNYTRTHPSPTHPTDTTGIDKLREVPFGLLIARTGNHMAAVVNGEVYEVHWDLTANDYNAIEATPLERFGDPADPWQSGAIAAPKQDLVRAGLNDPPRRR